MSFFDGNEFGESIFNRRYTQFPGETWEDAQKRQATFVGQHESNAILSDFYTELVEGRMAGGGRIAYSAGRDVAQMINCFVTPVEDSRESIGKHFSNVMIISGTGGGNGTNWSNLRYRGAPVNGTGGIASGPVSFMRINNLEGNVIRGGGGRRAAYMFALNHDHPDIIEFVDSKYESSILPRHLLSKLLESGVQYEQIPEHLLQGELNCANISVIFMNESPEDFFEKVRNDQPHELKFNGQVVRTIPARLLWDKIVRNALANGEPGILNGHLANEMNNIAYARKLECTNPCGEIWMQPYSVCCLGAVVLPRFVYPTSNGSMIINFAQLADTVQTLVRFLDDVLDTTHYPLAEVAEESRLTRRIGLGYMGVHDMLLMLGHKYSSQQGRHVVATVAKFIRDAAYAASVNLAKEKGSFPLFDAERVLSAPFIKTLPRDIQDDIRKYGLRNCALLTLAPYGTTSIVQGVTSGIETMFAPVYERTFVDGANGLKREMVIHPLFRKFIEEGRSVEHFEAADDISADDHIRMQIVCQNYIDNSISKTINIPQSRYTVETLSDLYMRYLPRLKGITIYPEGSRENTPLRRLPNEEGARYIQEKLQFSVETEDSCTSGVCAI